MLAMRRGFVTGSNNAVAAVILSPFGVAGINHSGYYFPAIAMRLFHYPVALAQRKINYGHLLFQQNFGVFRRSRKQERDISAKWFIREGADFFYRRTRLLGVKWTCC